MTTPNTTTKSFHHPLKVPSTLSADAQHLYKIKPTYLNYDIFDPKARAPYIKHGETTVVNPSPRLQAAADELEAANLLQRYQYDKNHLTWEKISESYTVAFGIGPSRIVVRAISYPGDYDGNLIAILEGGDIETRDRDGIDYVTVKTYLEEKDFEHSTSSSALIEAIRISPIKFGLGGKITLFAILDEVRLYPLGTDPITYEDDREHDPSGELCDRCENHHAFAPYLPPKLKHHKPMVRIDIYPLGNIADTDKENDE